MRVLLRKSTDILGGLEAGTELVVTVPDDLEETVAKARALRMLERDHPEENQAEWETEVATT